MQRKLERLRNKTTPFAQPDCETRQHRGRKQESRPQQKQDNSSNSPIAPPLPRPPRLPRPFRPSRHNTPRLQQPSSSVPEVVTRRPRQRYQKSFVNKKLISLVSFPNLYPPISRIISLHGGYKIQASLMIHRVPLQLEEPGWKREFRKFKEKWMEQTQTQITLDPSLIFMKNEHHRYISPESKQQKFQNLDSTAEGVALLDATKSNSESAELGRLLSSEGFCYKKRDRIKAENPSKMVRLINCHLS